MHGKLHEAETRLALAEQTYSRVQRAENRASVLQAKARLDEAEATLRRTQKLVELGAGAGKDLLAAEAAYKTAKAEYDYQSNISLNREVQEARAEVETARVEVSHIRNSLRTLGAMYQNRSMAMFGMTPQLSSCARPFPAASPSAWSMRAPESKRASDYSPSRISLRSG